MAQEKFTIGEVYYCCHLSRPSDQPIYRPIVESFIFTGFVERQITSPFCDKPYHFYHFAKVKVVGAGNGVYIPSLKQADKSMLSWEEFLQEATYINDDYLEYLKSLNDSRERD